MARPIKKGLDYFNIDCNQDDNLEYVEAKHGLVGYGIVVKLWQKIYKFEGYYCELNEKVKFLFCKDCQIEVQLLEEVLKTCFEEGIFDQKMYEKFKILTSKGVQKRWKKIVIEAGRKDTEIEEKYSLLGLIGEKTQLIPQLTQLSPHFSTQSKVKESKVNKKEKEKKKNASPISPLNFDFVEISFKDPFERWLNYKKSKGKSYKSQDSVESCYRKLKDFSGKDPTIAMKIVEQSISNNWEGLFELKLQKAIGQAIQPRKLNYNLGIG